MSLTDRQFEKLLRLATSGDQQALLELVLEYQAVLGQFVAGQMGQHLSTTINEEDILQETFVHAFRCIKDFKGTRPVAFVAWLKAIGTNRVRDAARKSSAARRGGNFQRVESGRNQFDATALDLIAELAEDGFTPSYFAARREAVSAIQAALVVLPEDQREAIMLHCFDKLSLEQTAEKMNRSRDSVRGLIQRGKQALRNSMQTSSMWFSRK